MRRIGRDSLTAATSELDSGEDVPAPLTRIGGRKSGACRYVAWREALDHLAHLVEVISKRREHHFLRSFAHVAGSSEQHFATYQAQRVVRWPTLWP